MQHRAAGTVLDLGQHLAHPRLIGGGDDKPQVVMMLAFRSCDSLLHSC